MTIPVRTLRELLRHLQAWQSLYETEGKDVITGPDGTQYCIHDIWTLVREGVPHLSPRQRQAISLFLLHNLPERKVAQIMGVSEDNPVASYATQGIVRLNQMISLGQIPGYSRAREPVDA
ncbi:sigma factor-like helix-turn-helix DNA-binding protein [Streptomyces sp. NPDC008079]|uniref:sigma factor-like helix-turn-helix DNA-binding protein n=1 Tax=Streptomyces sp. NPDC008079 TaxID=3364806 RepID=UPI0036E6B6DB